MIPESANWWGHRNGFLHSFTFTISVGWFGCPHRWFSCHVPQCLLRSICTSIGMYLDWWSYPDSGNTFASHFRSFSISCQLAFWNSPSFSERGRIGHISFLSLSSELHMTNDMPCYVRDTIFSHAFAEFFLFISKNRNAWLSEKKKTRMFRMLRQSNIRWTCAKCEFAIIAQHLWSALWCDLVVRVYDMLYNV